ncbi:MAG: energy transducer TonB, partial [Deltaproteobacteria bacterium]|nr:energy transducer TonB [Deltaproteobacteria bacterium]
TLDRAALKAVRKWKFEPASRLGVPFTMWVDVPVHFVLQGSK